MSNPNKLIRERPVADDTREQVWLGPHSYTVVPQPIGYLRSNLKLALGDIEALELLNDNVIDALGSKVYSVLKVFIGEAMMPEHEFFGFASPEAFKEEDYSRSTDSSPTAPEIRRAFAAAARVNELDLLKHLGKVIDPAMIRGYLAGQMADSLQEKRMSALPNSAVESGDTL